MPFVCRAGGLLFLSIDFLMPSREKLRGLFMIAMFREQSLHFVARRCLRTFSVLILSLFAIVGCSESEKDAVQKASAAEIDQPSVGVAAAVLDANLATVVAGSHRTPANVERDKYRRPVKVLEFFGIRPNMTVVEMWAEGGWWRPRDDRCPPHATRQHVTHLFGCGRDQA